jgi:predicted DNA-binding transcriptional regulator YafY
VARSLRLLRLLEAMHGRRRPVTAELLAELLGVSPRTIYRDVADLVTEGVPIEGAAGVGYILRPGFFLPPLALSDEEMEAVMLGLRIVEQRGDAVLRSAVAGALAKIGAVASPASQARMARPLSLPGPAPHYPDEQVPLASLRAAIRARSRLEIRYVDEKGSATTRVVWPIQLGFMEAARALFAWCELRGDVRTFRTDRIGVAALLDRYPASRDDLVRRLRSHLAASAS